MFYATSGVAQFLAILRYWEHAHYALVLRWNCAGPSDIRNIEWRLSFELEDGAIVKIRFF